MQNGEHAVNISRKDAYVWRQSKQKRYFYEESIGCGSGHR